MKLFQLIIWTSIVFTIQCAIAADTNHVFHVEVDVSGDSSDDYGSYLKRELRSLTDVVVTDQTPDIALHVIVMDSKTTAGNSVGYVASVAMTMNINSLPVYFGQVVFIDSSLKSLAERTTTYFDNKYLEPARQELLKTSTIKFHRTVP